MIFGYARVSSSDQNLERQMEGLKNEHIEKMFTEKVSGKDNNREQLNLMLGQLRPGDLVVVTSLDRLARSMKGFIEIWEDVKAKGAKLKVLSPAMTLDENDLASMLLVNIIVSVAEFERGMIRKRQKEGVDIAKKQGVYTGRKPNLEKHAQILELRDKGVTVDKIAALVGVNRRTVFRVCNKPKTD